MSRRRRFPHWKPVLVLGVLGLVVTPGAGAAVNRSVAAGQADSPWLSTAGSTSVGSSRAGAVRRAGPYTVSRTCTRDTALISACDFVVSYFRAINAGRYRTACGMLGARLRLETGGRDCPRVLAFAGRQRFGILNARHIVGRVGGVVALDLPELDHVRVLPWLALIGREHGSLKLLETRLIT
jgi:hypothetical protein